MPVHKKGSRAGSRLLLPLVDSSQDNGKLCVGQVAPGKLVATPSSGERILRRHLRLYGTYSFGGICGGIGVKNYVFYGYYGRENVEYITV
ncbi:MAG TPA: hypothetical protein EYP19_00815 [Desulfobacterales bacterium]|nr:hypothetical protein [Desulfobacterales bacterium]